MAALLLSALLPSFAAAQNLCNAPYPAFVANIANQYPKALDTASILPKDVKARTLFNKIKNDTTYGNVLNGGILPKGNPNGNGDFAGVKYNGGQDPDCWWSYTTCKTPKRSWLPPDYFTCQEPRTWGLSFDDGPNCNNDHLYSFLAQQNPPIKASVFYIGGNVLTYPLSAQHGVQQGHEVCVHTWSHKAMTSLTDEQVFAELYYTKKLIHAVTGVTSKCWRPAYGDVDDRVRTWAWALGMRTHLWDQDTFDWQLDNGTPKTTIDNNFNKIYQAASNTGGVVVLNHEVSMATMNEFIGQFPTAKTHYKNFMPVSSCNNNTTPYYESNITIPDFASYVSGTRGTPPTPFFTEQDTVFATWNTSSNNLPPPPPPVNSIPTASATQTVATGITGGGGTTIQTGKPNSSGNTLKISTGALVMVAMALLI